MDEVRSGKDEVKRCDAGKRSGWSEGGEWGCVCVCVCE